VVTCVAFAPEGRRLLSGSWDRTVRLWDLEQRQEVARLEGHNQAVSGCAFLPEKDRLLTAGWDKVVHIWDVQARTIITTLAGHSESIRSIALTSDGRTLATASWDGTVGLWDLKARAEKKVIPTPFPKAHAVAIAPGRVQVRARA
jgi:WD40 repeat protein